MIAKISIGSGFKGVVSYAGDTAKKGADIIGSCGVRTSSAELISASFAMQSYANPKVKKPVGHVSLSFSKKDEDKLTPAFLHKIAVEYMHAMGIRNTQYVIFRHHDQPHPHIHIIYNRVDNDGKAIKGDDFHRKAVKVCRKLTEKYSLTLGNGKAGVRRQRLKGSDATRYRIYDIVKGAVTECRSWQDLAGALAKLGVGMRLVKNAGGRVTGVVFTLDGMPISGSKVDRSLSAMKLNRIFGSEERQDGRTSSRGRHIGNTSPMSVTSKAGNGSAGSSNADDTTSYSHTSGGRTAAFYSPERHGEGLGGMSADTDGTNDGGDDDTGQYDDGQSAASKVALATVELLSPPEPQLSVGGGGSPKEDEEKKKRRRYGR